MLESTRMEVQAADLLLWLFVMCGGRREWWEMQAVLPLRPQCLGKGAGWNLCGTLGKGNLHFLKILT